MENKLATWRGQLLSVGGRVTLINSALRSLSVYNMSILRMPISVVRRCEGIMRRFLWSGKNDSVGFAKVAWNVVVKPVEYGGLGIGSLGDRNKSLMLKWFWEILNGSSKIRAQMVRTRYGFDGMGKIWSAYSSRRSPIWTDLLGIYGRGSPFFDLWSAQVASTLGNGIKLRYWWDAWATPTPMAINFPQLYAIAPDKLGTVASHGEWAGAEWRWYDRWQRILTEEEEDALSRLKTCRIPIAQGNRCDNYRWKLTSNGKFSVHSCCAEISRRQDGNRSSPLMNSCWKLQIPFRVRFFCWLLLRGNLPTRSELYHCRVLDSEARGCPLCMQEEETVYHLFVSYPDAANLWIVAVNWLGIAWVCPGSMAELWQIWPSLLPSADLVALARWDMLKCAIMWVVWLRRNKQVFNQTLDAAHCLLPTIVALWFDWIKSSCQSFPFSVSHLLSTSSWLYDPP